jgi:peptide/nickel transport system permease protein
VVVLVVVIMLIKIMGVIRTARAQGLVLMSQGFIIAAKLRGESASRIIVREMLPNILDLLGVEFALRTSSALLLVSTLSFLGLGLSPPTPDWGLMVHDGLQSIRSQPWLILVPAGCITSLVVGINFATEGVVDAFGMEHARGVAGH